MPVLEETEEAEQYQLELKKDQASKRFKSLLKRVNDLCEQVYGREYVQVYGSPINETSSSLEEKIKTLGKELKGRIEYEKKLQKERQTTRYKLKNLWEELFNTVIKHQPIACQLYYYAFMGQYFKNHSFVMLEREQDIRVHLTWISPSGIGKTECNDLLCEVSKLAGLLPYIVQKYNDASIIGSFNSSVEEYNRQKKLKPGDEWYKEPKKIGILGKYNFAIFDEGEKALKTTGHTELIQQSLQAAMNRYGSEANIVRNELVGGDVFYNTDISVIITSFYLPEFKEVLMTRGLVQRTILFVQEANRELRDKIHKEMIGGVQTKVKQKVSTGAKDKMEAFLLELKKRKVESQQIYSSQEANTEVLKYVNDLKNLLPTLTTGQQRIFDSMLSRLVIHFYKLACINAISEDRDEIVVRDVQEAYWLLRHTGLTALDFIKERVAVSEDKVMERYFLKVVRILGAQKMSKQKLNDLVMRTIGVGATRANQIINDLSDRFVVEKGPGNTKVYYIKRGE